MIQNLPSAPNGAELQKVGQTYSGSHGLTPDAKVRGVQIQPTVQTFGGGGSTGK